MENPIWTPPPTDKIVAACQLSGSFFIFTEKAVYKMKAPTPFPWYKKAWNWLWVQTGIGGVWR